MLNFQEELLIKGINPNQYLKAIKTKAMYDNYNIESIKFADDTKHKLQITDPQGNIIKFGASEYNDFVIYMMLVKKGKMAFEDAMKHRDSFYKRMKRKDNNIYSARNLALNLLWT